MAHCAEANSSALAVRAVRHRATRRPFHPEGSTAGAVDAVLRAAREAGANISACHADRGRKR